MTRTSTGTIGQAWKGLAVLAFGAAVLLAPPAFAGVVYEVETTYHSGSQGPESSEIAIEGKNFKMEVAPGASGKNGKGEMIFRGDRRQMVVIDHDDKSYTVIDGEAVKKLGGQMQGQLQQAMKEIEKRLEGMDPKQREMMEKMLKGQLGAMGEAAGAAPARSPSEFRETGESATKAGYPCVRYDVLRDGQKVRELWVTDWSNVEGGDEVAGAFEDLGNFFEEMLSSMGEVFGGSGFFASASQPIEDWSEIPGFPVVTRSFEGGELESETVLGSVTERDLDPDAFEPPKGYRLRTMGPQ